jgi:hypothetical protein
VSGGLSSSLRQSESMKKGQNDTEASLFFFPLMLMRHRIPPSPDEAVCQEQHETNSPDNVSTWTRLIWGWSASAPQITTPDKVALTLWTVLPVSPPRLQYPWQWLANQPHRRYMTQALCMASWKTEHRAALFSFSLANRKFLISATIGTFPRPKQKHALP